MKKIISMLMTAAVVMSISVTAFAVGSVSNTEAPLASTVVKTSNGSEITVESKPTVAETAKNQLTNEALGREIVKAYFQEINVVSGSIPAGQTVTLTFNVGAVDAGMTVDVLHYNGSKWEKVTGSYDRANGTVTGVFNSFSPVAVVVSKAAAVNNGSNNNAGAGTSAPAAAPAVKSPQTSDANMVAVAFGALMTAGVGAGFVSRKKK